MPKIDSTFNPDDYTPVSERIALFYAAYPRGRILTRLVSYEGERAVVEAQVYRFDRDSGPAATGLASERESDGEINAVACLENTETSAIGRALANLGFQGGKQRPSRDEMEKALRARQARLRSAPQAGKSDLHARAEAAFDARELAYVAQQHGLSSRRTAAVCERLSDVSVSMTEIRRLERRLRGWIEAKQRFPRAGRLPAAPPSAPSHAPPG